MIAEALGQTSQSRSPLGVIVFTVMYDVAIIGLGPVGCTAAILLAEAGLKVAAIEQEPEVYTLPRAVNLDGEIIRAMQKVGRGQTVQDLMQPLRAGDRAGFANSRREWLFGSESRAFGRNGWQPMNMFDQPELETYLREQATSHANVTAFIGYAASHIDNLPTHVELTFHATGTSTTQTLKAHYLIGCDGAASHTRKTFEIGWVDLGYNHDWLVVDVITHAGHTLTNDTLQVCDPDRIHTYVCTKDPYRRWEFKLKPGDTAEQMLDEDMIQSLIDPWTPRGTYTIRRAAVYQFHAANAERWRVGRVFIAGDAAHQTPPFLGQGMNTGMRDVINLSWKLKLVLAGLADPTLLDSYYAERAAHAHDLVDWAVSIGQLMEHTAEQERCARAGLPEPPTPPQLQSSGYGQGREQPPLRDGVVMLEQITERSSVGCLFTQPIVRGPDLSEDTRLDDLLGPGFAVVSTRPDVDQRLDAHARAVLAHLDARIVSLNGLELVQGRFDPLFKTTDTVIVRPDALVFGHTSEAYALNELIYTLGRKLDLRVPHDATTTTGETP